ncbi:MULTISPECIES: MSCRAMM family adhesin SdrC [Actinosynnema]|uniref:MSCRAMM family adhesin SdrC n=1 Tax=Actinosynnema TaxID=40566 RepID=UPI0020A57D6C|nr:MSCRAMM family adhesin SdrC [Actinosynnema pretiosum]
MGDAATLLGHLWANLSVDSTTQEVGRLRATTIELADRFPLAPEASAALHCAMLTYAQVGVYDTAELMAERMLSVWRARCQAGPTPESLDGHLFALDALASVQRTRGNAAGVARCLVELMEWQFAAGNALGVAWAGRELGVLAYQAGDWAGAINHLARAEATYDEAITEALTNPAGTASTAASATSTAGAGGDADTVSQAGEETGERIAEPGARSADTCAGSNPDTGAGSDADPESGFDASADAATGSGAGPDAGADAGTGSGAGSDVSPDAGTGSGTGSGAGVDLGSDASAGADVDADSGAGVDAGSEAGADPRSGVGAGTGSGSGVRSGVGAGSGSNPGTGVGSGSGVGATAVAIAEERALCRVLLGRARWQQGDLAGARRCFQAALADLPEGDAAGEVARLVVAVRVGAALPEPDFLQLGEFGISVWERVPDSVPDHWMSNGA